MSFPMRKYGTSFRMLFTLIAALAISTQATAEKASEMDEEVVRWFETQAMDEVREISSSKVILDDEAFDGPSVDKPKFGAIFPVHTWTKAFLAGEEGATPTQALEQWVAPLFDGGEVAGTIVAWRDPMLDGKVALAYFDDDVESGLALAELDEGAHLVLDPPLSSYFAIEKEEIRGLTSTGRLEIQKAMPVGDYQSLLAERYASEELHDPKEGYAGGGPMIPSSVARKDVTINRYLYSGLGLALAGMVLFAIDTSRRRRKA